MTRRILSIDIDCVMEPYIPHYDDFIVGSRVSAKDEWTRIGPPSQGYGFCAKRWALVKKIVRFSEVKNVVFGNHHHQILQVMPDGPLDVYNFDHHHDIEYPGWNDDLPIHEGNWVGVLNQQNRIKSYTWFRNDNSENLDQTVIPPPNYTEVSLPDIEIPQGPFDLLFVCLSPNWMPPQHWNLREELANACLTDESDIVFLDEPPTF